MTCGCYLVTFCYFPFMVRYFAGGSPIAMEHPRRECNSQTPCPLLVISNHSLVQHTGDRSLMAKFRWNHRHHADNFLHVSPDPSN